MLHILTTASSLKITYMQHDMAEFSFRTVIHCLRRHVVHSCNAV